MNEQKIVVSGFVYKEGKVLLLQRSQKERFLPGHHDLPGGKLDFGEDPKKGMIREIKEETGIDCEIIDIHYAWSYISQTQEGVKRHTVQIGYVLKPVGNIHVILSDSHDQYHWITEDELEKFTITESQKKEILSGFSYVKKRRL